MRPIQRELNIDEMAATMSLHDIADVVETMSYDKLNILREKLKEINPSYLNEIALINSLKTAGILRDYEGLIIELKGTWLWVHGNTEEHKAVLKFCGCRYCPQKKDKDGNKSIWVFVSKILPPHKNQRVSMRQIETSYGTQFRTVGACPMPTDD